MYCRSLLLSHSNPQVLYIEEEEHITGIDPAGWPCLFHLLESLYGHTRLPPSQQYAKVTKPKSEEQQIESERLCGGILR